MQTAKTAAVVTGAATQTAAQTTSSTASIGSMAANAIRAVTIDAGQTSAGVAAFLAPILGPAAPAAGEAAGGEVLAMAAFDTGAWSVPRDTIAAIHQGEVVVPSAGGMASQFRDIAANGGFGGGQGGGGKSVNISPQTHLHVSTMDSASFGNYLKSNSRELLKAIDHGVRSGAHFGLKSFR